MRRFLSPRWLGLHAAMLALVTGFCALGWWQLRRAEGGNALSWGYTFEWPLFAGFVVVFWLRIMRDELREAQARDSGEAPPDNAAPVSLPLGAGAAGGAGMASGAAAAQAAEEEEDEDEELAAYNAYLSRLNAEASRSPGWLSGRGSRRAAAWAVRPKRSAKAGGTSRPGDSPHMEV